MRRLFFLLLAVLAVRPAWATPVFAWSFNPATYSGEGPNLTVDMTATLTNVGSTELDSVDIEGATFMSQYVTGFGFGEPPISVGSPLAPGQSVNFQFFILILTGIPPGMYTPLGTASITLDDATGAEATIDASNLPTLVVTPEPPALLLMATGVVGLLGMVRRRARRKARNNRSRSTAGCSV